MEHGREGVIYLRKEGRGEGRREDAEGTFIESINTRKKIKWWMQRHKSQIHPLPVITRAVASVPLP
jgi:hypothetical protein